MRAALKNLLKKTERYRSWILVGLVILFSVSVRVRLREMPLERDEGEYAYAGQLMLQGIPPYKLAYNMKLPGTYAAYAVLMAVFGQSVSGVHLGLTLVNSVTIALIFLLGRRLLDDVAGIAAAAVYALMALSPTVLGLQAHATHYVVLFAVAGALVLVGASETGRRRALFASGFLFGAAYVMKQHGVLFGAFGLAYVMWMRARVQKEHHSWSRIRSRSQRIDWRKYGAEVGVFVVGLTLPYLLVCLLLAAAGVFSQFTFWTIRYANQYISIVSGPLASRLFRESLTIVASPNLLLWVLAAFGAILLWSENRIRRHRFFLPGLLLCSCVSISIGLFFRSHYFILLLPALSLLAAVAVSRGWYLLKHTESVERILSLIAIGLFLIGGVFSVILHGEIWFAASPVEACRMTYASTLFPEAVGVGRYLKEHAAPNSTVAVLGSEPEIYFYSHRHSATGYLYVYPLMEQHDLALTMQEQMIREVEAARPEYVVVVQAQDSWLVLPESKKRIHEWWAEYRPTRYDLVQTIQLEPGRGGEEEKEKLPRVGAYLVFKRKAPS